MWIGFACLSVAALIFGIWGVPALRTIAAQNSRAIRETNCRARIVEQLDAANAELLVRTTAAVHPNPLPDGVERAALVAEMDEEAARVKQLGILRGQSNTLCHDDPDYTVPEELTP
jgi:hypothetical protein